MFTVKKTFTVSGSHRLKLDYESACANPHGHNWKITVTCQSPSLDSNGMVVDFKKLKTTVVDSLDHKDFNEVFASECLDMNPTAENIALYIANKLHAILPYYVEVKEVEVVECEGSIAIYTV